MKGYESWGRYPKVHHIATESLSWRSENIRWSNYNKPILPYGLGRSYGDSCLNDGGYLFDISPLNHFIDFNHKSGIIRCEAGVPFAEVLDLIVPSGWFLPVTPGTKYVTVGGAIANDIHGKNHHREGTFGCHVLKFELLRSNGERLLCSASENKNLFEATIGGLGLTGIILWAEFRLKQILSPMIDVETIKFKNLDEYFELSAKSDTDYNYTVAWLDCLAKGEKLGRGLLFCGNHSQNTENIEKNGGFVNHRLTIPIDFPNFLLNQFTVWIFNHMYYSKQQQKTVRKIVHYDPFFYPLDALQQWNRIYGKRGFLQYQCVVPTDDNYRAVRLIVQKITESGLGSFLTVIKTFGDIKSPGLLSFPKKGVTLAFDFANQGQKLLNFLEELDSIVKDYDGSVYPAKDARMSAESFQRFYPQWREFTKYIDPKFSSSFWRRVSQ